MLATVTTRMQFAGNASNVTAYVLPYRVLRKDFVRVAVTDEFGVTTVLQNGADFVVELAENSASVRTVAAYAGTTRVTVWVEMPLVQDTNLTNHGRFDAEQLEYRFDYVTALCQLLAGGGAFSGGRALSLPLSDPTSIDATLPNASKRRNGLLGFDANGAPKIVTVLDLAVELGMISELSRQLQLAGQYSGFRDGSGAVLPCYVQISWGDGTAPEKSATFTSIYTWSFVHTYAQRGIYTVYLSVRVAATGELLRFDPNTGRQSATGVPADFSQTIQIPRN